MAYDAVGNRKTSSGSSYTYDNTSNHLLITPGCSTVDTYDAHGNTLTKAQPASMASCNPPVTLTYAWDFEKRLTSAFRQATTFAGEPAEQLLEILPEGISRLDRRGPGHS